MGLLAFSAGAAKGVNDVVTDIHQNSLEMKRQQRLAEVNADIENKKYSRNRNDSITDRDEKREYDKGVLSEQRQFDKTKAREDKELDLEYKTKEIDAMIKKGGVPDNIKLELQSVNDEIKQLSGLDYKSDGDVQRLNELQARQDQLFRSISGGGRSSPSPAPTPDGGAGNLSASDPLGLNIPSSTSKQPTESTVDNPVTEKKQALSPEDRLNSQTGESVEGGMLSEVKDFTKSAVQTVKSIPDKAKDLKNQMDGNALKQIVHADKLTLGQKKMIMNLFDTETSAEIDTIMSDLLNKGLSKQEAEHLFKLAMKLKYN